MRTIYIVILLTAGIIFSIRARGQTDGEPPASPMLSLVSVDYLTGNTRLTWVPGGSPDVSGYVIYLYSNSEGHAIDTIYDPTATDYTRTGAGSSYFSESFVVSALDSSGNVSPLSNDLRTIYTLALADSCNNKIEVTWNQYMSSPRQVLNYSVLVSVNGATYTETAQVSADQSSFTINDFIKDVEYCIVIRANLEGGVYSGSNRSCIETNMQNPPRWINANYATITPEDEIKVSFTADPESEIKRYVIERKTGSSGSFEMVANISTENNNLEYIDTQADIGEVHHYRVAAVNNCGLPVIYSNIAANIVASIERKGNDILLRWNHYRKWEGYVDFYLVYASTGGALEERATVLPVDSVYAMNYNEFMHEVSGDKVCFMIEAHEASNPYGINGISRSSLVCTPVTELITVPNLFTPDNNGVNDLFRPVLSFTPVDYLLTITDMKRRTLFESRDHNSEWDGTYKGSTQSEGVYLWFLKVVTPSGKNISKRGTVTIVYNR